jgi:uncharacterized protein YyaL (SSP411 family)
MNIVRQDFARDEGAWYAASVTDDAPLGRRVELMDNVIPGGCSVMLDLMLTRSSLSGDIAAVARVSQELAARSRLIAAAGLEMAGWLDAALRLAGPRREVVVAGEPGEAAFETLWRVAARSLTPGSVLASVPAQGAPADLRSVAPVLDGKEAPSGTATVYVCEDGTCHRPIDSATDLEERIREGWVG